MRWFLDWSNSLTSLDVEPARCAQATSAPSPSARWVRTCDHCPRHGLVQEVVEVLTGPTDSLSLGPCEDTANWTGSYIYLTVKHPSTHPPVTHAWIDRSIDQPVNKSISDPSVWLLLEHSRLRFLSTSFCVCRRSFFLGGHQHLQRVHHVP